jgi:hypothetical protein
VAGIILSDAGLTATYGSRATAVRDFVHDHVVRKWMARDQWGFLSTTPTSDKPYLLANIMLGLGRAGLTNTIFRTTMTYQQGIVVLLNSYLATVSAPSGPIATAGAELHHYKGYTGATFCGDAPNTVSPCSGDTEHENRIPHTIQRAVDMGYSSLVNMTPTGSTLEQHAPKLARLLGFVIWDRSTTLPRFTNYVDGANHHFRTRPPWDNGVIGMGWLHIAHHHADAISAGRSMLQCVRTGCASPSRARNAPVQARTGLAGTTALAVHRGP